MTSTVNLLEDEIDKTDLDAASCEKPSIKMAETKPAPSHKGGKQKRPFDTYQLLTGAHLYEEFEFSPERDLHRFTGNPDGTLTHLTFDAFCVRCDRKSTFRFRNRVILESHDPKSLGVLLGFDCSRSPFHRFLITIDITSESVRKIGQAPSQADIEYPELDRYLKALKPEGLKEFKRAVGLAAHGVGVGAMVYLRRIIERLVGEVASDAAKEAKLDSEKFATMRFSEKVSELKDRLPEFLGSNPFLYSILSKAVHELGDEECLDAFEPLKTAIELILVDRLTAIEKADKISKATADLRKIKERHS